MLRYVQNLVLSQQNSWWSIRAFQHPNGQGSSSCGSVSNRSHRRSSLNDRLCQHSFASHGHWWSFYSQYLKNLIRAQKEPERERRCWILRGHRKHLNSLESSFSLMKTADAELGSAFSTLVPRGRSPERSNYSYIPRKTNNDRRSWRGFSAHRFIHSFVYWAYLFFIRRIFECYHYISPCHLAR